MADDLKVSFTDEARTAIEELSAMYGLPREAILEIALGLLRTVAYAQVLGETRVVLEHGSEADELVLPPVTQPRAAATGT